MLKQVIKGNQIIFLNDPSKLWAIQSGSFALFATAINKDAEPVGPRFYLFSVGKDEAMFGTAIASTKNSDLCIIAVAIEETEVLELFIQELGEKISQGDEQAIAFVEIWVEHLGEWVRDQPFYQLKTLTMQQAMEGQYLSLKKGQGIQPARDKIIWVEVRNGHTNWLSLEDFKVDQHSPPIPLAPSMWLEADNKVEVYCAPTTALEKVEELGNSLNILHRYFFGYFNLNQEKQLEDRFHRFQEREKINRQLAETSMEELAAIIKPPQIQPAQSGTPILMAAGAVGRHLGITVLPPAQSEDLNRIKDPLEAIARASQFRTRRVILGGEWWQQEHGALLGYRGESKQPVALLPDKDKGYTLFEPETKERLKVDESLGDEISPEAYMFYRPLPGIFRKAYEIFFFGIKGYEFDLIWIVVLGVVSSLLGMVTPQATAILVNSAIPDGDRGLLWQLGLGLFGAALGKSIFTLAQGIITLRVENAADANIQPAVWDRLLKLTPGFFRQYASGDLLNRLLAVGQIRGKLSGATQRTLLSAVFALLNLALMFVYSTQLAWVILGLTVVVVAVTITSSKILITKQRAVENLDGVINGLTVELINGVAKLRVAAAEERAFAAWAKKYSQRMKIQSGIKRIDDSVSVFNEALSLVASVLLFWFAIYFIGLAQAKGESTGLNMGTFLAFNSAFGTFLSGTIDLSNTVTDILEIVPLWERAQPILVSQTESDPTKADPGRLTGRLALDHVTFRYRDDGPLILDDVSIEAEPGEFIALVGPSGSGKSTVFRLLLGFETPISGTVSYDGQDLAGLDIQAVRRQLGVVLQNVRLSSAPIFDSIACGALVTLDEAWEAARMAGFAEDVEKMPMGMHTVISEGGSNLSGGQRQRLLIARALVLKPKIILMDEATSALDNRTQAIVTESLDRMNATRIVVAHRLSTIRNADRIYVIEAGRVVQVGNFDELVNLEGIFARLVARQLE